MVALVAVAPGKPRFADTLRKEPSRLLRDAEFPRHLRRRDALARRGHHVDRHKPLVKRQARFGQNRAGANAEMLAAVAAAVRHRLVVLDLSDRQAAAMGAGHFAGPTVVLEIEPRGFLAGEALEELIQADGFRLVGHET